MQLKVQLKFNSEQADGIRALASALGVSEQEYCRLAALKCLADAYRMEHKLEQEARNAGNNAVSPDNQGTVDSQHVQSDSATLAN